MLSSKKDEQEHGDGFEYALSRSQYRLIYSFPIAAGWWILVCTLFLKLRGLITRLKIEELPSKSREYRIVVKAIVLTSASILLGGDYHRDATVYVGYYHLGLGAYLLTSSFILLGVQNFVCLPLGILKRSGP